MRGRWLWRRAGAGRLARARSRRKNLLATRLNPRGAKRPPRPFLEPAGNPLSSPPSHCPEWRTWAHARGGVDERLTQLRVTLTARHDLVVVVDGLRVRVRNKQDVPRWRAITCAVGGADISPRRADIRLSDFAQPTVSWLDDAGSPIGMPTFSLSESEAEMIHVWAHVGEEWVEWAAELLVLVNGHRQTIEISDAGRPFITTGSASAVSSHMWISGSDEWHPAIG
jgi:hypothetical protein